MKKSICLLLTLPLILALASAGMTETDKPAPTLTGTTEYDFVGYLGQFDAAGRLLAWQGTISGDIEGVIQWWLAVPMATTRQVSHYDDRWVILDGEGDVLLAGDEAGSTTVRQGETSLWRTNGTVTEASEEFENWLGRQVHEEGEFTWAAPGVPDHGWGTFRAN
jgi:predicted phosphoadenosine phosphosulfate sulfurtransferase